TVTQYSVAGAITLTEMLGLGPARSAAVAFGPFGEVLVVTGLDGSIAQFDAAGAHDLTGLLRLGPVRSVGVAFGPSGEALVVTGLDGSLTQFDAAGAHDLTGLRGAARAGRAALVPPGAVLDRLFGDDAPDRFNAAGLFPPSGG